MGQELRGHKSVSGLEEWPLDVPIWHHQAESGPPWPSASEWTSSEQGNDEADDEAGGPKEVGPSHAGAAVSWGSVSADMEKIPAPAAETITDDLEWARRWSLKRPREAVPKGCPKKSEILASKTQVAASFGTSKTQDGTGLIPERKFAEKYQFSPPAALGPTVALRCQKPLKNPNLGQGSRIFGLKNPNLRQANGHFRASKTQISGQPFGGASRGLVEGQERTRHVLHTIPAMKRPLAARRSSSSTTHVSDSEPERETKRRGTKSSPPLMAARAPLVFIRGAHLINAFGCAKEASTFYLNDVIDSDWFLRAGN
ncbi:hypothetical protein GGX14DRAFT_623378 [Mycena pura]|uniref:Uncharacterized protein n=1 Tax=Mycena pura TaxID=153505 RepID=A0AAD6VJF3_9AGAR|nr:hypothetical protein GGX14DRAFT_623378 [Mycena pura]